MTGFQPVVSYVFYHSGFWYRELADKSKGIRIAIHFIKVEESDSRETKRYHLQFFLLFGIPYTSPMSETTAKEADYSLPLLFGENRMV